MSPHHSVNRSTNCIKRFVSRTSNADSPFSGELDIDLKAAAKAWGAKKASPVPMKELETLTGYIRGGVSPIGAKKRFPVFLHDSARQKDTIIISAGKRGYQLELTPTDLLRFTDGHWFTQ